MLTWFPQEISSSCVSACTRIVLTSFGVTVSEEQVRLIETEGLDGQWPPL